MKPRYFYTRAGAERHAARVADCWQNLTVRVSHEINDRFRTVYFVEVRHPSPNGRWARAGSFSTRAPVSVARAIALTQRDHRFANVETLP